MFKIITLLVLGLFGFTNVEAGWNDPEDVARININVFIPEADVMLDPELRKHASFLGNNLEKRLKPILSKNGFTGSTSSPRFMVFPTLHVVDRDVAGAVQSMDVLVLELNLYVADYVEEKIFANTSLQIRGVGKSEVQALRTAMNELSNNKQVRQFLTEGRQKILQYYDDHCDLIIEQAQLLTQVDDYEKAFRILTQVPSDCRECYNKVMELIPEYYTRAKAYKCEENLHRARVSWAAKKESVQRYIQDHEKDGTGINIGDDGEKTSSGVEENLSVSMNETFEAVMFLEKLHPTSPCYNEALTLINDIKTTVDSDRYFRTQEVFRQKIDLAKVQARYAAETNRDRADANRQMNNGVSVMIGDR